MQLVMLVVARHFDVSAGFVCAHNYPRVHRATFILTTTADYNVKHEERVDEPEVNRVGPSQDCNKEDEAEIPCHPTRLTRPQESARLYA